MTSTEARTKLHDLIESLPSEDVPTVLRILEALNSSSDPVPLALRDVPIDDEPETDEERAAVAGVCQRTFLTEITVSLLPQAA